MPAPTPQDLDSVQYTYGEALKLLGVGGYCGAGYQFMSAESFTITACKAPIAIHHNNELMLPSSVPPATMSKDEVFAWFESAGRAILMGEAKLGVQRAKQGLAQAQVNLEDWKAREEQLLNTL